MFLTTSFFIVSLSLLKSTRTGTNLSASNLSTLLFKLLKPLGTFLNLFKSDFKLAKSTFLAKNDVSTPVAFFKSGFVQLLHLLLKILVLENIHSLYCLFYPSSY